MLTMTLQIASAVLFLAFGAVALAVARRPNPLNPFHRETWGLTGVAFGLGGANQLVQNLWGAATMWVRRDPEFAAAYYAWGTALNHSRTFCWIAFFLLLAWLLARRDRPGRRAPLVAAGALGAGLAVGALLGVAEGRIIPARHFMVSAAYDAVELLVLLTVVFACLLSPRVDRYLWSIFVVYGFNLAQNILWVAALSFVEDPRSWSPSPWMVPAYRTLLIAIILAIGARRLQLARRSRPVLPMLGRSAPSPAMFAG